MKKKIKANKTIMLLLTLLLTLSLVAGLSACGEGAKEKSDKKGVTLNVMGAPKIGRASCRERV